MKALDKSIEHWERLAACKSIEEMNDEGYCGDKCALCDKYYSDIERPPCRKCPVAKKTGKDECHGTPYHPFRYAAMDGQLEEAKRLAKEELEFLRSLK